MMRSTRVLLAAAISLGLAGCELPRSGPYYSELTTTENAPLPFSVVSVTPDVVAATMIDERRGFAKAFLDQPAEDVDRIARDDVLSITIWESVDEGLLSPQGVGATPLPNVMVDERGMVFVPYVGPVRAAGRTVSELRDAIQTSLAEKTLNPQVDVQPVSSNGRRVSVQGAVNAPGLYPIERSTNRLLPMLARAGGIREDPEVILLSLRRNGHEGEIWVQDLYDNPALNVALRPGDSVIAERDRRVFTILGAVGGQSLVPFPSRDVTLTEAMARAGGLIDQIADPTGVFLFREELPEVAARVLALEGVEAAPQGTRIAYVVDMTKPGGMFVARDFRLRDRDTLFVTNAPFVQWQKVMQSIAPLVGFSASVRTLSGN
ncbi:polysaccharide biosynthesis/export family protein [Limibaculum sp. M0105]|uniref:Polysaccharide biosynthesis/export family protein n=1 Tax=Thermohalobaculum xanthum TaxID=2753746 RepID=A0A8J7M4X5_9RHOB|nr:polysaccharide biosynthesis/export family protein [Thermohalobaculum xanthum]MBK0398384.1 polysaccharide biosynthesis/export family protein [Thermohalobaculum xanthum]